MADTPPSLRELQRWMRWVLTEPRGVAAALAQPRTEPQPRCLAWIDASPALDVETRLNIYAEGYFTRLSTALAEQFPALAMILGHEEFCRLSAHYLAAHPPNSPNIAEAGRDLPGFLAGFQQGQPALADLARLEWARLEALQAEDVPKLDAACLQHLDPNAWATLRVLLDPSLRLLASEWPIDFLQERREMPPDLEASPIWLMVFRQIGEVRIERLTEPAFLTLGWMARGLALQEIFEELAPCLDPEAPLPPVQEWFVAWVLKGVIRKLG